MTYTISVSPSFLTVSPTLPNDVLAALKHGLSYSTPGFIYSSAYRSGGWDGRYYLFKVKTQTAPAGVYKRTKKIIQSFGHSVEVVFTLNLSPKGSEAINGIVLEDFQKDAVKEAIEARYCIISAPVRAGKTAIFSSIINKIDHYPVWVITNGIDLVRQTRDVLKYHLQADIGCFSESSYIPGKIVVSSYQAMSSCFGDFGKKGKCLEDGTVIGRLVSPEITARNDQVKRDVCAAKVLILDECHHATSKKSVGVVRSFTNAAYKVSFSGTPKPDNMPIVQMESILGPVVMRVKFDKLIKSGRIAQPLVILYDLPYRWFSTRMSQYKDVYTINVVENKERNRFIVEVAENLIKAGKTVFILVRMIQHGELLRDLIPNSVFVHGSITGDIRKGLYEALQSQKLSCIVATVGREGLNLPKLDAVINAEGYKGKVTTIQKLRSLTACSGKSIGLVIDFLDKGRYIKRHSEARRERYSKLTGFIIRTRKVPKDYYGDVSKWF